MSARNQYARTIAKAENVPALLRWVQDMAAKGLPGGPLQVTVSRPSRNREQEKKFHAMIHDIHQQCFRGYSAEGVKAVLVNQFALEMAEQGTPLASPGEQVWCWKTKQPVYVRPSTKKFRKAEAAAFIEFLYSVGAEYDVTWSERALAVYDEMMRESKAA